MANKYHETLWATQQAMSVLFDVIVPTINYHLSQIFKDGELQKDRTIRKNRIVQLEGNLYHSRPIIPYEDE